MIHACLALECYSKVKALYMVNNFDVDCQVCPCVEIGEQRGRSLGCSRLNKFRGSSKDLGKNLVPLPPLGDSSAQLIRGDGIEREG